MTLPNPPPFIHHLDVFNDIVRIEGDFIITLCGHVYVFAHAMNQFDEFQVEQGTCMQKGLHVKQSLVFGQTLIHYSS